MKKNEEMRRAENSEEELEKPMVKQMSPEAGSKWGGSITGKSSISKNTFAQSSQVKTSTNGDLHPNEDLGQTKWNELLARLRE